MVRTIRLAVVGCAVVLAGAGRALGGEIRPSTYRLDNYALQIDKETQFITGIDGGFVDGNVVTTTTGNTQQKHLAGVTIEPIHAKVRIDQFTQFISDSLEGKSNAVNGSVYYIDTTGKVQQQRDYTRMMLTELAFPLISASSKLPAGLQLGLTLTPEQARSADVLAGALPPVTHLSKAAQSWQGGFRLTVPGLPTNRVSIIEPFTIHRKVASDAIGNARESMLKPAAWEIPNLVFYMLPNDSQAWLAWHEDFVIKGNCTPAQEKQLSIEFLMPNLKDTMLTLQCDGVGIISAKYEQPAGSTSTVQGFRVEVYVQKMSLIPGGTSTAAAPAAPADPGPSSTPPPAQPAHPMSRPMEPTVPGIRPIKR